jgi:Ca2+-binding EF-hand superfamily protein
MYYQPNSFTMMGSAQLLLKHILGLNFMRKFALLMLTTALLPVYAHAKETGSEAKSQEAAPAEKADPIKTQFDMMDLNKDGYVSLYESLESSRNFFKVLDSNGDGSVSESEFIYMHGHLSDADKKTEYENYLKMNDMNKDGKVTEYENMASHRGIFKKVDSDDDDAVTLEEFRNSIENK